jgi:hypothetical protein
MSLLLFDRLVPYALEKGLAPEGLPTFLKIWICGQETDGRHMSIQGKTTKGFAPEGLPTSLEIWI